jgi:hypothetical protein
LTVSYSTVIKNKRLGEFIDEELGVDKVEKEKDEIL